MLRLLYLLVLLVLLLALTRGLGPFLLACALVLFLKPR